MVAGSRRKKRLSIFRRAFQTRTLFKDKCNDDQTIDEIISRISTSKGLYKMHWLLTEEAKSKELNDDERKLIKLKGESAKTKGMNLLAKEKNVSQQSKEIFYLHRAAQQEAMIGINESEKVDSSGEEEDSHLFSDSS